MNNVSNSYHQEYSTSKLVSPPLSTPTQKSSKLLKLGVLASGNGSNFEAIAQAIDSGQLNATIVVVVYNNPQAQVRERALNWQVPSVLINHRQFARREDFDEEIVKVLQQYQVELVVMAGWMRVMTEVLLNSFPNQILNIHPSLLPSFPGIKAVEQALQAGVKITGCTVHLITLAVDSGPILIQAAVPILPEDTPETLHARIQSLEHQILPKAIAFCADSLD